MNIIEEMILEEARLQKLIAFLRNRLKNCSDASLEVITNHGRFQYYYLEDDKNSGNRKHRKYIKKDDRNLAVSLAQRDYDKILLEKLEKRLNALHDLRKTYDETAPEELINTFCDGRKELIQPLMFSSEEYARKWQEKKYQGKEIGNNVPEFYTVRGERVRSKSEVIIADTLERRGIPYHYEHPLILERTEIIYPDFTVLNVRTRKTFFWEHLGKMDDEQYVEDNLARIELYERNGIFPGTELLLTFETKISPLNKRKIDAIINKYLC